jgi:hypothetical protein
VNIIGIPFLDGIADAVNKVSIPVQVLRQPIGTYGNKGRWEEQEREKVNIKASVQATPGEDLMRLEEGDRTKDTVTIFTTDKLLTTDTVNKTQADLVLWNGHKYQVQSVKDWGNYIDAVAVKVEE